MVPLRLGTPLATIKTFAPLLASNLATLRPLGKIRSQHKSTAVIPAEGTPDSR